MAISPDDPIIQKFKQQYSDIFGIEIAGVDYIYRGLTVAEIKHAAQFSSETDQEDYYVRTALLYPADVDVDRMLAGHFVQLAQAIMSSSGLFDIDTVQGYLDTARLQLESDVLSVMKCYIIAAMPSYKDVDLDVYTIKELIDKVVMAEQILTLQQGVMGIETEGVKIYIVPENGEAETTQKQPKSQKQVPPSAKKKAPINLDKEELLRRIRSQEAEMGEGIGARAREQRPPRDAFDGFDPALLEKMWSGADPDDPIARKLHGG